MPTSGRELSAADWYVSALPNILSDGKGMEDAVDLGGDAGSG